MAEDQKRDMARKRVSRIREQVQVGGIVVQIKREMSLGWPWSEAKRQQPMDHEGNRARDWARRRGSPLTRWRDELRKLMDQGSTWQEQVEVNAFALQQTKGGGCCFR